MYLKKRLSLVLIMSLIVFTGFNTPQDKEKHEKEQGNTELMKKKKALQAIVNDRLAEINEKVKKLNEKIKEQGGEISDKPSEMIDELQQQRKKVNDKIYKIKEVSEKELSQDIDMLNMKIDNILDEFKTSNTCYSENFVNDPNFTSLSSIHAYWDSSQGNYYVKTYDNEQYQYWAYSPQFTTVNSSSDLTIKFDMLCENADWGTYPGVHFYNNAPTTLDEASRTLAVKFSWSDNTYKKITVSDVSGNNYKSTSSFSNNTWYTVEINYYASTNKADILVKEKSTGDTFYQETNVNLILSNFSYLGLGFYSQPNYGDDWSPIRIDNIEISGNCTTSANSEIKYTY